MSKDEFDFTGENLATLFPVDKKAVPFDYEARLKQKGYMEASPPDIGGLVQALATDYVPTRVVQLPPKRVTRVRVRDYLTPFSFGGVLMVVLVLEVYVALVVLPGIFAPYAIITSYEAKVHIRSSGTCTVTSTDIYTNQSDDGVSYTTKVYFTLRTLDGKSYQTQDYWPSSFSEQTDAQHYASEFHINQPYQCWYNAANPTQASFFQQDVSFWDYFGLVCSVPLFLVFGVLPNLWLLRALLRALWRLIVDVKRGNTEIVW